MEGASTPEASRTAIVTSYTEPKLSIFRHYVLESLNDESPVTEPEFQSSPILFVRDKNLSSDPGGNLQHTISARNYNWISQDNENYCGSRRFKRLKDNTCSDVSVSVLEHFKPNKTEQEMARSRNEANVMFTEAPNSESGKRCSQRSLNVRNSWPPGQIHSQEESYCKPFERKPLQGAELVSRIESELKQIDEDTKEGEYWTLFSCLKEMLEKILFVMKKVEEIQDLKIPKTQAEEMELNQRRKQLPHLFRLHEKLHYRLIKYSSCIRAKEKQKRRMSEQLEHRSLSAHARNEEETRGSKLIEKTERKLNKIDSRTEREVDRFLLSRYELMLERILIAMKKINKVQLLEVPKTKAEARELNSRKNRISKLFEQHKRLNSRLEKRLNYRK